MKWYSILALTAQPLIWILLVVWMIASRYEYCCCCFGIRTRRHQGGGAFGAAEGPTRGLEPAEIERFPRFGYPKVEDHQGVKMSRGITECAVCLGAFMHSETLRLIPKCGHVFHADCVDVWLRSHATCPYCRANLMFPPPQTISELPV